MATWKTDLLGQPIAPEMRIASGGILRPVRINFFFHQFFFHHRILIDAKYVDHLLVDVSWFSYHPRCTSMGKPITVWCPDIYETHIMMRLII